MNLFYYRKYTSTLLWSVSRKEKVSNIDTCTWDLGLYPQHFIFFVSYNSDQEARVLVPGRPSSLDLCASKAGTFQNEALSGTPF
jgi:hypothetical protein